MNIHKATVNDKKAILDLVRNSWHDNFADPISYMMNEEKVERFVADLDYYFDKFDRAFVCEINNKIVGFVAVFCNKEKTWLSEVFVDKEYQKQGIGTALVKEAIKGLSEVYITINERNMPSQALFSKLGFKKIVSGSIYKLKK